MPSGDILDILLTDTTDEIYVSTDYGMSIINRSGILYD